MDWKKIISEVLMLYHELEYSIMEFCNRIRKIGRFTYFVP